MKNKFEIIDNGSPGNKWAVYGVSSVSLVDNGSDFASKEFKRVAEEVLKSNDHDCHSWRPDCKGTVERFFRALDRKVIHELPGTTKSNY